MTHNPYRTPAKEAAALTAFELQKRRRPLGISLIAILHLLGGLGVFWMLLFVEMKNPESLEAGLKQLGSSTSTVMIGFAFIACLQVVSAVGLWRGAQWGWRVGVFYYVFSITQLIGSTITLFWVADQFDGSARDPSYYFNRNMYRLIFRFLFLAYLLFNKNVLQYFGLEATHFVKEIMLQIGLSILVLVVSLFFRYAFG